MAVTNSDVHRVLAELTLLTKLEDESAQSFRVRAYESARQGLEDITAPVADMTVKELVAIKGVGKSIAEKIREYVDTGTMAKVDELREKYPPAFVELTRIPGMGPKTVKLVRRELGIQNVEDLKAAVEKEELRELPGLGAKTEEKIAKAIERLGLHGKDRRTPIGVALSVAGRIVEELGALPQVDQVQYCGSLRRFRDTVADVDILVASSKPEGIMDAFTTMSLAHDVVAHGETKSAVLTREGLQVDLRVVKPEEFGAAILYFTGSKEHNIALRQRALDRGWTLNEYSLSDVETEAVVAAATEQEIYEALEMDFVPPPLRENHGEIAAAAGHDLPRLVELGDIKGDLHVHSSLSGDGRSSLEKMLAAAVERGLDYLAITDHGEDLAINGASRTQMLRQRKRLIKLQDTFPDMTLLHGCELNIGKDGTVDYDDEFLAGFDWCVASVHSYFDLDAEAQTIRIIKAMQNPAVSVIGHLSGRKIGRRPSIELDIEPILEAAELTGTAIEINGAIDRLDASATVLRAARGSDVLFTISTDSHHTDEFRRAAYGVLNAQRGWVERDNVVNTWPRDRFLEWAGVDR